MPWHEILSWLLVKIRSIKDVVLFVTLVGMSISWWKLKELKSSGATVSRGLGLSTGKFAINITKVQVGHY